ncbi:6-bladed beta-propeller [Maribellus sediminis]|uniref:6-bladed beta-propeller n=1 Tax=Maribellus sediminis TaxID=2696285 RepID=UPI0014319CF9|nr:6-bladed beta-propeller [Maribellus sediminis]
MSFIRFYVFNAFIIFAFTACKVENNGNNLISLSEPESLALTLTDIAEDVTYVRLSSKIPIQHIHHLEVIDDNIFISCHPEMIVRFDLNGNLLGEIGKKGRGPQDYERTLSFTLDYTNKHVIVLSNNFTLKFYDFSGEYVKTISLKNISDFSEVSMLKEGLILLTRGNPYGNAKFNWIILDIDGKIIDTKENHVKFNLSTNIALNPSQITCKFQRKIIYYESFNDTIFAIDQNHYVPQFIFERDQYRMTSQRFISETPKWINEVDRSRLKKPEKKYYHIRTLFMTTKYFWIGYSLDYYSQLALIDNKTNELYTIYDSGENSGLLNDYDGGLSFFPESYFEKNNSEFLCSWINSLQIKGHIFSRVFKSTIPQYPEKKKELEKLANNLNENDNPVLMLVKLKE